MRSILFAFLILLSNFSIADECIPVGFDQSVTLRGVVEKVYEKKPNTRRAFSLILRLPAPVCVQGTRYNGSTFKQTNLKSIRLGISKLNKGFHDGESVVLRGELWPPTDNEPTEQVTFAIKEVL